MPLDGLPGDVWQFLDGDVPRLLLVEYFEKFAGRAFNTLGGAGDSAETWNRFTAADLLAVTALSVSVPPEASIKVLGESAASLNERLARIPRDVELQAGEALSLVTKGSHADRLWAELRAVGIGPVTTSKLLARKRPKLLPVFDSVIQAALLGRSRTLWVPLWQELQDPKLVERLKELRTAAKLGEDVSLLRVLDVVVWMRNQGYKWLDRPDIHPLPFRPVAPIN